MLSELYNLDRRKIDRNKRRLDRLLGGSDDILVKVEWTGGRFDMFDQPACYNDFEQEYKLYLSYYNMLSESCDRGFDNIPFMRVDFCRVAYLMAIAYGCKPIFIGNVINAKPIIHSIEQISAFRKPENICECGFYPEITRRMHIIEERLGDVLFVSSDTQSPMDVLTEIMDTQEAMCAMYEEPEPIHALLDMLTESIEEINRFQAGTVQNWLGFGHDYPITRGIHLSDDDAAFLSPRIYEEFAAPYAERLSRAFGGLTLHCCMRYRQCIEPMSRVEGLMGFDPQFAHHSDGEILPHARGKFLRVFWIPNNEDAFSFYKRVIDSTRGVCGLMLEIFGSDKDSALRLGDRVREYSESVMRAG